MASRIGLVLALAAMYTLARADIVDRISVVVGNRAIKQSDIEREIRVVSFLNHVPLDMSLKARKEAASRLIDQVLIKQEIQTTGATPAPLNDAERLLDQIRKDRYPSESKLREALMQYGITEEQLKSALLWQLSVLRFISQRFGGASGDDSKVVDQQFEQWLDQARKDARIGYREEDLR